MNLITKTNGKIKTYVGNKTFETDNITEKDLRLWDLESENERLKNKIERLEREIETLKETNNHLNNTIMFLRRM